MNDVPISAGGEGGSTGQAGGAGLSLGECYVLAWRSFSKLWIPLCLVAGLLVVTELLPKFLARAERAEITVAATNLMKVSRTGSQEEMFVAFEEVVWQFQQLMKVVAEGSLRLFPLAALLTAVMLMLANVAVEGGAKSRHGTAMLMYVAVVHTVLAAFKYFAFCMLVIPGAYLYVKLFFVSLVMLEKRQGALAAIATSWRLTQGNFWKLFLLIAVNSIVQAIAYSTIIGAIPVTGFANTARAAAYRMLQEKAEGKR